MSYAKFLEGKSQFGTDSGFKALFIPDYLYDFQKTLVEWSLRKGRSALFEDCGLGKTPQQLVWAQNVVQKTNKPVMVITPLAVTGQTAREATKFSIDAVVSRDGKFTGKRVIVTNYERIHYFNPDDFGGVVCDESSAIKNFEGERQKVVTEFMRKTPYRLLCTATASPNDYIELGTSSEALGELGRMDMLSMFFKNDENSNHPIWWGARWRFKAHAEEKFWRWVTSWARALRRPSDLGFDDKRFVLPKLIEREHVVKADTPRGGELFDMPAVTLDEQREERRLTIDKRCAKVAELVAQHSDCSVVFCHLNSEGDLLEKLIPGSQQVSGSDSEEWKELSVEWFQGNRCICNLPIKNVKLAKCGNQNTPNADASSTILTLPKELRDLCKSEAPKKTKNTCGTTTSPTSPNGIKEPQSNEKESLKDGVKNTHPIRSSGKQGKQKPGRGTNQKSGTAVSEDSLESRRNATTPCSKNREEDALSAAERNPTDGAGDSPSTTAIKQEKLEDYCAEVAISVLGNSMTTAPDLNGRHCTCGHKSGKRVIISKPVMFGFGLNLQHCNHMTFFPSHSFEQYYQGVRRCWRFGQKKPVTIDLVTSEGELGVMKNLQRKAEAMDKMFTVLVKEMQNGLKIDRASKFEKKLEAPSWL